MKKQKKKILKLRKEIIAKINLSKIVGGNNEKTVGHDGTSNEPGCPGA